MLVFAMDMAMWSVKTKAEAEGREASEEDYRTALDATFNAWLESRVRTDMAMFELQRSSDRRRSVKSAALFTVVVGLAVFAVMTLMHL